VVDARADAEAAIEQWLEAHHVAEPWRHSATLASAGLDPDELAMLSDAFSDEQLQLTRSSPCEGVTDG